MPAPYGSNPMPAGGADDPMPADGGAMGGGQMGEGVIHIPKDMLPEGMAAKVKPGDILEFRAVAGADSEGDIPVEYNHGEGHGDEHEETPKPWEEEFREHMSPAANSSGGADGGGY